MVRRHLGTSRRAAMVSGPAGGKGTRFGRPGAICTTESVPLRVEGLVQVSGPVSWELANLFSKPLAFKSHTRRARDGVPHEGPGEWAHRGGDGVHGTFERSGWFCGRGREAFALLGVSGLSLASWRHAPARHQHNNTWLFLLLTPPHPHLTPPPSHTHRNIHTHTHTHTAATHSRRRR